MAGKITRDQLLQIENFLALGRPIREIAKEVGCSTNTVLKHKHDPNLKLNIAGSRQRLKELHAQESVRVAEKAYSLLDQSLGKGKAFDSKAVTGALKDLDQLSATAAGEDRQAGVPAPALTQIDVQAIIGKIVAHLEGRALSA